MRFSLFVHVEIGTRAKKTEEVGMGEEMKETLAGKPQDFAERVRPQTWSSDWCGCLSSTCHIQM